MILRATSNASTGMTRSLDRSPTTADGAADDTFGRALDDLLTTQSSAEPAAGSTRDATSTDRDTRSQETANPERDANAPSGDDSRAAGTPEDTTSRADEETSPEERPAAESKPDDASPDHEDAATESTSDESLGRTEVVPVDAFVAEILAELRTAQAQAAITPPATTPAVVNAAVENVGTEVDPTVVPDAATPSMTTAELEVEQPLPTTATVNVAKPEAEVPAPRASGTTSSPALAEAPSTNLQSALPEATRPAAANEATVDTVAPTAGEETQTRAPTTEAPTPSQVAPEPKPLPNEARKATDLAMPDRATADDPASTEEAESAPQPDGEAKTETLAPEKPTARRPEEAPTRERTQDGGRDSSSSDRQLARQAARAADAVAQSELERAAKTAQSTVLGQSKTERPEASLLDRSKGRSSTEPASETVGKLERATAPRSREVGSELAPAEEAPTSERATVESAPRLDAIAKSNLDSLKSKLATIPSREEPTIDLTKLSELGTWKPAATRFDAATSALGSGPIASPVPLTAIYSQLKAQLRTGAQELKLRLDPPALGQLNLRFVMDGDSIAVHVRATRPEVVEALKNDLSGFMDTLRDSGIDLTKLEIALDDAPSQDAARDFQEQMEHAKSVADEDAVSPSSQPKQRSGEPVGERSTLLDVMA